MPNYRHTAHAVFLCDYHLVFATKYRRTVINPGVKAFLLTKIDAIRDHYPDSIFKEVHTDKDHIHLLVSIPPQWPVGKVVGLSKAHIARALKAEFPFLTEVYWGTDSMLARGLLCQHRGHTRTNYTEIHRTARSGRCWANQQYVGLKQITP